MLYNTDSEDLAMNGTYKVTVGFMDNSTHVSNVTTQYNGQYHQTIWANQEEMGFFNLTYIEFAPSA